MKAVEKDTRAAEIVGEELRLLGRVSSALSRLSVQVTGAPDFEAALINLRDQIAEAKPEDIGPLVEQMMRISAIAQRYGKGRDLPVDPVAPYFAHMRLDEDERLRDVLIGKRGFIDRTQNVHIVDWRNAPVSRIYYRYDEGDDYEERFGDKSIEGVVRARRSVTIDEGQLKRIACPQGTFVADKQGAWHVADSLAPSRLSGGQGSATRPPALQRGNKGSRLGVHSDTRIRADKHLPEIAALIDPKQFELITRPDSGVVLLQGGAGSGKTTVALHRVAYLNFAKPGRFSAGKILVVVLTEALVRYVRRVLPSLGVQGVAVVTAANWLRYTRRKVIHGAPDRYNDDTPGDVLRLKKHPLMLRALERFVQEQVVQWSVLLAESVRDTPAGGDVVTRWETLSGKAPVERCLELRSWLRQTRLPAVTEQQAQGVTRRMLRRFRDVLTDWAELLSDRQLLEAALAPCAGTADGFSARQIETVASWCARQSDELPPRPSRESAHDRRARGEDAATDADADADDADAAYISVDGRDERDEPVVGHLDPPDDALLLRLAQLKFGELYVKRGKPLRYEHLVIDEAQDLSAVELKVLLESTSRLRSVTLAGDAAQRLAFDNGFSGWESLLGQLAVPVSTNTTLKLGYRSTEPIMELARTLMDPHAAASPWQAQRAGALVELHRFSDQGEAIAMIADALRSLVTREPLASIACIARFPEQARAFASAVTRAEVPCVRLVLEQDFSFKAGIDVCDVTQVKGLEFDYVILTDASAQTYPNTEESRNMLYIGATRASHQLWLLCIGEPSPLLPRPATTE